MPGDRTSAGDLTPGRGSAARPPDPATLTYEAAVGELESVVARLEGGDLPLEEALQLFERGVTLARRCAAQLDAAERQVELLRLDAEGRPLLRPLSLFDGEGNPAGEGGPGEAAPGRAGGAADAAGAADTGRDIAAGAT